MRHHWLALAGAVAVSLAGQVLLKAGATGAGDGSGPGGFLAQLLRWQTIVGLGLYGGSAMLYIVALRRIPMSVALPCTAASYVLLLVLGWALFGEAIGPRQLGAIALICGGVLLLATA